MVILDNLIHTAFRKLSLDGSIADVEIAVENCCYHTAGKSAPNALIALGFEFTRNVGDVPSLGIVLIHQLHGFCLFWNNHITVLAPCVAEGLSVWVGVFLLVLTEIMDAGGFHRAIIKMEDETVRIGGENLLHGLGKHILIKFG